MPAVKTPSPGASMEMGKRKRQPEQEPDPVRVPLFVEINPQLKAQLEKAAVKNHRKLTGEVSQALEEYLTRIGLWPPPEQN